MPGSPARSPVRPPGRHGPRPAGRSHGQRHRCRARRSRTTRCACILPPSSGTDSSSPRPPAIGACRDNRRRSTGSPLRAKSRCRPPIPPRSLPWSRPLPPASNHARRAPCFSTLAGGWPGRIHRNRRALPSRFARSLRRTPRITRRTSEREGHHGHAVLEGAGCPLSEAVRAEPGTCAMVEALLEQSSGLSVVAVLRPRGPPVVPVRTRGQYPGRSSLPGPVKPPVPGSPDGVSRVLVIPLFSGFVRDTFLPPQAQTTEHTETATETATDKTKMLLLYPWPLSVCSACSVVCSGS